MTVQEVNRALVGVSRKLNFDLDYIDEEDLKTIKKALEKQIPKKPQKMTSTILIGAGWKYKCPNCELGIGENEHDLDLAFTQNESYCPSCGQKLDWEEGGTSD